MIGNYRQRIRYRHKQETGRDKYGDPVYEWKTYKVLWANVAPYRGREYWDSRQVQSEVTHKIRHRYFPGIKATMEIHYDERVFEIEHYYDVDERLKEIELQVKERLTPAEEG